MNVDQRFWSKASRSTETGCWVWNSSFTPEGPTRRARFSFQGKNQHAARVAWFLTRGVWPSLQVLHRCDNPACVSPFHIFEGTVQDNVNDMLSKRRHAGHNKTHCKNGHEFTKQNTRIIFTQKGKKRACKQCESDRYERRKHVCN